MTNLEFKINVEINLSENTINWLSALLSKVDGFLPNPCTVNVPTIPATSEAKSEVKAEANPKGKAEVRAEVRAEANPKGKAEAKSKVDLETLRTLLREKVNEHRAELKAKLNELGAANLTVLSPAKYQEMYEYLKSL